MEILKDFYSDKGDERVGFVVGSQIIEVENICSEPNQGFMVSSEDIMTYGKLADATWHTHPDARANLSEEDYVMIRNYPDMIHYIVGSDGVRCYQYNRDLEAVVEVL